MLQISSSLIFVYFGFYLTSGYHEKCTWDLENYPTCLRFRCPIYKCGNFSTMDNLTCVCDVLKAECVSEQMTAHGCVAIRIAGDDQKYEVRPCIEAHPFICSDGNANFQIYAEENSTWSEALHTCEERNLHIAQVNLSIINHTSDALFWIGSFYSSVSTGEIDVSKFQMTFDSQEMQVSTSDTMVKCEIQPEEFRMTTSSVRPTYGEITPTTDIGPSTYLQTTCHDKTLVTVGSDEDIDVAHSNTAVIVGSISGCVVLIIIGVSVVYVKKSRNHRKPQNNRIQMSDIVGLAGYTDQSLRGKSRANEQPQNPIYLPQGGASDNGLANSWCDTTVELQDESNYDLFEKKKIRNDIESETDTYDHTRLDIQGDAIDLYGVLHQGKDGIANDVYDHVGAVAEETYGHLHQKDETSRPDSDTYDNTSNL